MINTDDACQIHVDGTGAKRMQNCQNDICQVEKITLQVMYQAEN